MREQLAVFAQRHGLVVAARHEDDRNVQLRQLLGAVERIFVKRPGRLVGQAVDFLTFLPAGGRAYADAQSARPAANIHHRRVQIELADVLGIGQRVVDRIERAAAEAENERLVAEIILLAQHFAEGLHVLDRRGAAVAIGQADVGDRVAVLRHGLVHLRKRVEELRAPHPAAIGAGLMGMNEYALVTLELEILSPEASPFGNSTHCFVSPFFAICSFKRSILPQPSVITRSPLCQ